MSSVPPTTQDKIAGRHQPPAIHGLHTAFFLGVRHTIQRLQIDANCSTCKSRGVTNFLSATMFLLSWRGYGLLGLFPPLLSALVASILAPGLSNPKFNSIFYSMLTLSAIAMWFVGKHLNGDADYEDAPHCFMHFRLQYAGLIYVAMMLVYFIVQR